MNREVVLIRHGQTEWSKNGRHTSITDLPLLPEGETAAQRLRPYLEDRHFSEVFSSPRTRAVTTARLAIPGHEPEILEDLAEWDYGDYEGRTSVEIREGRPDWDLWTHGAPGGESPVETTARVDRACKRLHQAEGDIVVFAHGHILRALAVRWLGLDIAIGRSLLLETATISILDVEHGNSVLRRWNAAP